MRLRVDTAPDGTLRVRDAVNGRPLAGVFRVELRASGATPRPELVIYLDAAAHAVAVECASVVIDQRPRTCPVIDEE